MKSKFEILYVMNYLYNFYLFFSRKQILRNTITQNIHAGGGTYIGSGLEMAKTLLTKRATKNPLAAILLLTDGQDNERHNYSRLMASLPEGAFVIHLVMVPIMMLLCFLK